MTCLLWDRGAGLIPDSADFLQRGTPSFAAGPSGKTGFRLRIVLASRHSRGWTRAYLGSPSVPLDAIIDHHVLDESTMVMWNFMSQISQQ